MVWLRKMIIVIYVVLVPLSLLFFSVNIKMPLLAKLRNFEYLLFALLLLMNMHLISVGLRNGLFSGRRVRVLLSYAVVSVTILSSSFFFYGCYEFDQVKKIVFSAGDEDLGELGSHFIIGYRDRDFEEVMELVRRKAIGGVFLTSRNVRGKSVEKIREEIGVLQRIQKSNGLPRLLIATDQEGGIVSRCSPPLKALPSLSSVVESCSDKDEIEYRVKRYAFIQSMELSDLGFNLNFSPVVDLKNSGIKTRLNLHTRTDLRAISEDKDIVTKVAMIYSKVSEKNGVRTTLKHFPGLSMVGEDTHLFTGSLNKSEEYLEENDWVPFRKISEKTGSLIMLGHVLLREIDSDGLVSCSKRIVDGVIRKKWKHDGVLITDDINMGPVVKSEGGIGGFSIRALNAGVDLILVSYDGDQYYRALGAVLKAKKRGELDKKMLERSKRRLGDGL